METKEKIELLQKAVQQLIDEEKGRSSTAISSNHHQDQIAVDGNNSPLQLSELLSQLDSLKEEDRIEPQPPSDGEMSANATEEIMKEMKDIKKQNSRTHWLLSLLIMLTLAWQLSEVSVILKVKQGITNPFKSFGNMVTSIFKGGRSLNEQELKRDAARKEKHVPQIYSLPGLKAPAIPNAVFSNQG